MSVSVLGEIIFVNLYSTTLSLKTKLYSAVSAETHSSVAEGRVWKTPDTSKEDEILLQIF